MGDGLSLECEQGGEGAGRVRHLRHCGGIGTARHVDIAPAGLPVSLTVFGTHGEKALTRGLSCPYPAVFAWKDGRRPQGAAAHKV